MYFIKISLCSSLCWLLHCDTVLKITSYLRDITSLCGLPPSLTHLGSSSFSRLCFAPRFVCTFTCWHLICENMSGDVLDLPFCLTLLLGRIETRWLLIPTRFVLTEDKSTSSHRRDKRQNAAHDSASAAQLH